MLLRRDVLDRIAAGEIDLVYRLWRKPTVKAGGRLRTAVGELSILAVDVIDPATIEDVDAARAGFASAAEARASLVPKPAGPGGAGGAADRAVGRARTARPDGTSRPYRIAVAYAGSDGRAAVREDTAAGALLEVQKRLRRMDRHRMSAPWTHQVLTMIAEHPGRRAPDLAAELGRDTLTFKADVRKLKELGLTESLRVGYRLSPRGQALLASWPEASAP